MIVTFVHLIQSASSLPTDASAFESAISALVRDITSLESSSVPLERSLPWFTGLVALGVAMEFWVIRREYFDEMTAWACGTIRPPERPSLKKLLMAGFSVLLITSGIVGELWVGLRITSINGKLRTKNAELRSDSDGLLALVTRQAGAANISAKGASKAASSAQTSADAVIKEADTIEWIISARRVQDVDGLIADLKNGFKGHPVIFRSYKGDEEGFWLCSQLADIARKAEMEPQDECASEPTTNVPITDLLISAPSHEEAFNFSKPLKKPGRVPGYFVGMNVGPVLTVLVGIKPSLPIWPPNRSEETPNKNKN